MQENNKPVYKKWWFWFIAIMALIAIVGISNYDTTKQKNTSNTSTITNTNTVNTTYSGNSQKSNNETKSVEEKKVEVTIPDFSKMSKKEVQSWCDKNKIECFIDEEYSSKVKKGDFISQNIKASNKIYEGDEVTVTYSLGKKPTTEELNALAKAESYSSLMYMSKAKIYNQLTSDYGEGFDKEAAQYAIDNIKADWNYNALQKAKSYQSTMNMSKKKIYQQLISEYGEQFTKSQAQYAIDHLDD